MDPSEDESSPLQYETDEGLSGSATKKRRGPTRCLSLFSLPPNKRLRIEFDKAKQPFGKHVPKMSNFCGVIARDPRMFRLDVQSWRKIDKDDKERAWQMLLEKFEIVGENRSFVMKTMGRKWKDYKCGLKRTIYDVYDDDAIRYEHRPDGVPIEQWAALIDYWNSELGQRRSETNKKNRSQQTMLHTSGSKSFACLRHEEEDRNGTGIPPSRAEMWIKTHSHKDGVPVDDDAAIKIKEMQEILENLPEGSKDTSGPNDVLSQVMGAERPGRVRGFGLGPTPTKLWGSSSSQDSSSSMNSEEITMLREKIRTLEENLAGERAERENERSSLEHQLDMARNEIEKQREVDRIEAERLREVDRIEFERLREVDRIEAERLRQADKDEAERRRQADKVEFDNLAQMVMNLSRCFGGTFPTPPGCTFPTPPDSSTQPPDD